MDIPGRCINYNLSGPDCSNIWTLSVEKHIPNFVRRKPLSRVYVLFLFGRKTLCFGQCETTAAAFTGLVSIFGQHWVTHWNNEFLRIICIRLWERTKIPNFKLRFTKYFGVHFIYIFDLFDSKLNSIPWINICRSFFQSWKQWKTILWCRIQSTLPFILSPFCRFEVMSWEWSMRLDN